MATRTTIVTPEFRLGFNFLFNPKVEEKDDPKDKTKKVVVEEYLATMIFDSDADLSDLKDLVKKTKFEKWGDKKVPNWQPTFVKGEDRPTQEGEQREEYQGKIVLYAKNKFRKPGIVNEQRKPFIDEGKLYPGCYCVAEVTCFGWTYMGKSGVSFGLENIMKVGDGERIKGSGGAPPEEVFKEVKPRNADNSAAFESEDDDDDEL